MPGTGQWTDPTGHVWASGEVLTAANLVSYVEKNLAFLGAGYGAIIYRSSAQSSSSGATTLIQFDGVENDPQSMATTGAAAKITIPTNAGGLYAIAGGAGWAAVAAGQCYVDVYKNGSLARSGARIQMGASANPVAGIGTQLKLAAADTIDLRATQTSGGSLNINGGQTLTWLAVHLLGPF